METRGKDPGSYAIQDNLHFQIQLGNSEIQRCSAHIHPVFSAPMGNRTFVLYGEYTFYFVLKGHHDERAYQIKSFKSPFIKVLPLNEGAADPEEETLQVEGKPKCDFSVYQTSPGYQLNIKMQLTFNVILGSSSFHKSSSSRKEPAEGNEYSRNETYSSAQIPIDENVIRVVKLDGAGDPNPFVENFLNDYSSAIKNPQDNFKEVSSSDGDDDSDI